MQYIYNIKVQYLCSFLLMYKVTHEPHNEWNIWLAHFTYWVFEVFGSILTGPPPFIVF